jgi:transcriptional regulator with XRE-family HTH domain
MITVEELMKTEEYWFETIQNELFRKVETYLNTNKMTQTQLAEKLGVSKGYVSQILNGNFNATLKKLIELSLALDMAPLIDFVPLDSIISDQKLNTLIFSTKGKVAEPKARYKKT